MKTYWKIVGASAAFMLVLLLMPFSWHWPVAGMAACLAAGRVGIWLAPRVPEMHTRGGALAAVFILAATGLQGAGLICQLYAVWGLGLALTLALPLATAAHDIRRADEERAAALA